MVNPANCQTPIPQGIKRDVRVGQEIDPRQAERGQNGVDRADAAMKKYCKRPPWRPSCSSPAGRKRARRCASIAGADEQRASASPIAPTPARRSDIEDRVARA